MALLESLDLPMGTPMPAFQLPDPDGKEHSSQNLMGPKGLLVAFTCNHCPYAIAIWPQLIALAADAQKLGINTVGINPNIHPDYPEDAPAKMKEKIKSWKIGFPYLVDATQKVAGDFKAQCTPDLYLFDAKQKLVYHGRLDDLNEAISHLSQGKPVDKNQKHSMGCSIKWRLGH